MITPSQIPNPYVKPKWQASVGTMESIVNYNCRINNFPRPVLAMPMWESAGNRARDYSGRGNHGTLNGPTWVADGIDFDRTNDYIDVGSPEILQITGNITLSALIKTSDTTANQFIISRDDGTNRNYLLAIQGSTGFVVFSIFTSGSESNVISTTNVEDGNLHDVVGVNDGTNLKIYVDGELEDSNLGGNIIDNDPVNVAIGRKSNGSLYFGGVIYTSNIYNTDLSASQVKFSHYNPYFMYQIPEELYGYVAGAPPVGNPFWYYNMLRRRN